MEKYKLYFVNSKNERTLISETQDEKSSFKVLQNYLKSKNIKSYYTRMWSLESPEKGWRIDYGSYTEFFDLVIEKEND